MSADPLRDSLFAPCETKQQLRDWILCYLGIDFPDGVVYSDSTISPMGFIWLVYDIFRTRRFGLPEAELYKEYSQLMAYASRASYKTLAIAIVEVAVMYHMGLSVAHVAAIEEQSKKAQSYVKDAVERPYLRDFVVSTADRKVEIAKYVHRATGEILSPKVWKTLPREVGDAYEAKRAYVKIVVCTMRGTNSEHCAFMCVDEVDVVADRRAYKQAKLIPDKSGGVRPLTVYVSSRKSSAGLVQKELDEAGETGLKVEHWNVVDVSAACPPERHLPDEPKVPIYRAYPDGKHRGTAVSEEEYLALPEERRKAFVRQEGYAGCLRNCRLFFACHGRLADAQADRSPLLKELDDVTENFRKVDPGMANAELLCRKPSDEGLVYPGFDREVHLISAAQMAEMVTGDEYPATYSKDELVALFTEQGLEWGAGLDHGHTHNFAVVTGARNVRKLFILDVQSAPGLELDHKVALMDATLPGKVNPRIWPDTSEPGSNKTIKRKGRAGKGANGSPAGYRIQSWKKGPDSVHLGIGTVQAKLRPALGEPEVYLLKGDPGCELLALRASRYAWKMDDAGRPLPEPIKVDDDELDAWRYYVMCEFPPQGKPAGAPPMDERPPGPPPDAPPTRENYLSHFISQHLGEAAPSWAGDEQEGPEEGYVQPSGGKVCWDI